jgi:pimeloyl-ACP methyl ester carboxylesterase
MKRSPTFGGELPRRAGSKELVADASRGVQLAMLQELMRYWAADYDWRQCEAELNALPQFTTEIEGLGIHFIHVKSRHENALPLIITHGWPGSVIEMLGVVGPLTDPTTHGGSAEDAFDLVLPSLPGYGFSGQPTEVGWDPGRVAQAWAEGHAPAPVDSGNSVGCRSAGHACSASSRAAAKRAHVRPGTCGGCHGREKADGRIRGSVRDCRSRVSGSGRRRAAAQGRDDRPIRRGRDR